MKHDLFEAMYRREADAVLQYLRYRVGPDAAEDLVAETFSVAWQKLARLPDPPLPWLLATARRISANHLRARRKRIANEAHDLHEASAVLSADATEDVLRRRDLMVALNGLPPRDREAILLVTWHDLTNTQAAEVMGCSTTALAVRLHRARRRLGRILGDADARPTLTTYHLEDLR